MPKQMYTAAGCLSCNFTVFWQQTGFYSFYTLYPQFACLWLSQTFSPFRLCPFKSHPTTIYIKLQTNLDNRTIEIDTINNYDR